MKRVGLAASTILILFGANPAFSVLGLSEQAEMAHF
jgi:hypothetical protein